MKIHFCLSLKGALNNFKKSEWKNALKTEDGRWLTPDEVKSFFIDCLSEGKLVLPMGDCDKFDYKTGCPGHEIEGAMHLKTIVPEVSS